MSDVNEVINNFCSNCQLKKLPAKYLLSTNHKKLDSVYYLQEGFVRMYFHSDNVNELIIKVLKNNSFFPLITILGLTNISFMYECLTPCTIRTIKINDLLSLMNDNEEINCFLRQKALYEVENIILRIKDLHCDKAKKKIIISLLYLSEDIGEKKGDEVHFNFKFTHEFLGNMSGVSRETATRELKILKKMGIIKSSYSSLKILKLKKLSKFL